MIISKLNFHNLHDLTLRIDHDFSYGIAGFSGSGKSSFCNILSAESKKRLVTLLPKSEYQFLFPDLITTNFGAFDIEQLPLILYLRSHTVNLSHRSTVGTLTGIFRSIRGKFATETKTSSEFFSFNLPLNWCPKCKGRGSTNKIICTECGGNRYSEKILQYQIKTSLGLMNITVANNLPVEQLLQTASEFGLELREQNIAQNMTDMGIGYLSLNRTISTLSGGELTRLHIAQYMASSSSIILAVDELSLGLDEISLRSILSKLEKLGKENQIWLVDHSQTVLETTKKKVIFWSG